MKWDDNQTIMSLFQNILYLIMRIFFCNDCIFDCILYVGCILWLFKECIKKGLKNNSSFQYHEIGDQNMYHYWFLGLSSFSLWYFVIHNPSFCIKNILMFGIGKTNSDDNRLCKDIENRWLLGLFRFKTELSLMSRL